MVSGKTDKNCDSALEISDGAVIKMENALFPFLPARPAS